MIVRFLDYSLSFAMVIDRIGKINDGIGRLGDGIAGDALFADWNRMWHIDRGKSIMLGKNRRNGRTFPEQITELVIL